MPVSIGPRIQVDGEEEYRRQINQIIQQSKTLDAEMKAMAAGFSDTATEQEKAAATSGKLSEKLELARKRTELVRDMTEQASAKFGENSSQALKWRQALAAAEEQQATLERAVEKNTRAIDAQGEEMADSSQKMVGWGDTLNDIGDKLGIRIPQAATNALNGIDAFSVGTVAKMTAAAGAVAAAVKVVKDLNDITLEAAASADELLTRSAQTGLDTTLLQQLDYAQNFLDFSGIDKTLVRLTTSMDKARDGAEKQAEAFAALGVSVTDADGQLKNNYDTFLEVIDALGEVQNATERDILANDLFGKSFSEMTPLVNAGSKSLQGFMDKAKQTGIVLTEDQVKKLGEVDDAHQELQAQIEATKNKIAAEFAPATLAAMEMFADAVQFGSNALEKSGLISDIGTLVELGAKGIDTANKAVSEHSNWIAAIQRTASNLDPLQRVLASIHDVIGDLSGSSGLKGYGGLGSDIAGATWQDDVQAWVSKGGTIITHDNYKNFDKASGKLTSTFYLGVPNESAYSYGTWDEQRLRRLLAGYNAAGTDFWRGGLTWVGEGGPELVELPRGSAIYPNQESRQIAAAATDTSRIEGLLERCLQRMDGIERELADGEAVRRMA